MKPRINPGVVSRPGAFRFPKEISVFKGLAGLGSLLKQAQELSTRMKGLNDELRTRRASGTAGGGMVEIEINGVLEVLRCRIDPSLFSQGDRELLEDLVTTAVNQAIAKAKELHAEALQSATGGMDMPGLDEAMKKLLGGNPPEMS
jgi:DNA-binding YbaB/EbfC family protein